MKFLVKNQFCSRLKKNQVPQFQEYTHTHTLAHTRPEFSSYMTSLQSNSSPRLSSMCPLTGRCTAVTLQELVESLLRKPFVSVCVRAHITVAVGSITTCSKCSCYLFFFFFCHHCCELREAARAGTPVKPPPCRCCSLCSSSSAVLFFLPSLRSSHSARSASLVGSRPSFDLAATTVPSACRTATAAVPPVAR